MTKNEFLIKLMQGLSSLPTAEIEGRVDFYSEMIDNRMEEGLTEEEAVADVGEVELTACDAAEIFIQTDTGDVTGSLRTAKTFHADSDTGRVRVPYPSSGGKCEIQSDTGDILISVLKNE